MQLNENIKISIFKKKDDVVIPAKDTFVHYWNNTEENFPDCSNIENYLKPYIDSGNYSWVEIQDTSRFIRSKILSATLTLNISDKLSVDQIFVKIEYNDGVEIPQYYYGTEIDVMTNQNNPTNDYTILLELDMWSTFGCMMHNLMKADSMTQHFLCNRKMCDRFKYEWYNPLTEEWEPSETFKANDPNYRLGLNFMLQPWLLNTGKYSYPLVQATDDLTEEEGDISPLKLEDWLAMNGCSKTDWKKWMDYGSISVINCKEQYSLPEAADHIIEVGQDNYIHNHYHIDLMDTDFKELIDDKMFNSKGKYRYMIVKFGSNNTWSYKLNTDKNSPDYDEEKIKAYNNARTALKNYPDLTTLLNDVVLGGGKTCITTKKVQGVVTNKSPTEEENKRPIYLNGECVCLIPIPKGKFEQLYLFYLNSHDKGIVLGNGTILGMVINDIPPSVFAAALRKYNEELKNANMQTIGDKLSTTRGHLLTTAAPLAWTTLRLDGNWDWDDNKYEVLNANDVPSEWITVDHDWYKVEHWGSVMSGNGFKFWLRGESDKWNTSKYFMFKSHYGGSTHESYKWMPMIDPIDSNEWSFWNDNQGKKHLIKNEEWYGGEGGGQLGIILKYEPNHSKNNNPQWCYDNWTVLSSFYVPLNQNQITYENISSYKKLEKTNLIPPVKSTFGNCYILYPSINYIYLDTESQHYFPTIFHDFSYIPITVARKVTSGSTKTIEGQGTWFNVFDQMLTDKDIYSTNNRWSEPFLWGPQFYQWIYFTDGLSKITLTADQVDWFKIHKPTWNVNLRTNMSSTTNLKLDIDDIVNENYPFSKSASEFIISDTNKYPFTTEAYNNWYEQNAVSEATSKRAKDITNEFARKKYPISAGLNLFSSAVGGATAGAAAGPWGALAGGITGLLAGGIGWGLGQEKLNLEIAEADQKWANEWAGTYGNLYGRPAEIIADGFTSGSLLYTPNGPATDVFELFRMFTINPEARDAIGEEIFTSGYPYMRMCEYKDYDNRANFNIVNFNLDERNAIVNNYLKRELSKSSLIFSQQKFIDWFKSKCKSRMRLFKKTFDFDSLDDLIKTNIENNMK